jgi:hypothetical protein
MGLIDTATEHHVHFVEHGNMSIELKEYTYQGAWTSDQKSVVNATLWYAHPPHTPNSIAWCKIRTRRTTSSGRVADMSLAADAVKLLDRGTLK